MSNVAIYGAGQYGRIVLKHFRNIKRHNIVFFIVSEKNETLEIEGVPVKSIHELTQENIDNVEIFVATSNSYWDAIKEGIHHSFPNYAEKDIHYIDAEEILRFQREDVPLDSGRFLSTTEPISRLFGGDRGKPIDRYYIEKFLEKESKKFNGIGCTLEVGEDLYSRKYFSNAKHDILDYLQGMDLTKEETIPQNKYDVFICTQTYNFIYDVRRAIIGSYKLLKKGGTLLATVAGNISQVSAYDMNRHGDYWRFTYRSIELLMREVFGDHVKVESYGNVMAATAFIQGVSVEEVATELLDEADKDYAICIGIVAQKLSAGGSAD